ncbi:MAG TPA: carboxypeptidase M32, partial [Firmicutes bacterium]|nr:carboxypeptidase M32 [Bacillota bacterium]
YDSALDMYEPGERSKDLDRIFEPIKDCIKTLLPMVLEKQSRFPKSETKPYSIDKQRQLAYAILSWEKYDLSKGCMRESMHPFTTDISQNDTRITTNYSVSDWRNALYSEIHEAGHALEFQNKPQEMYDNYLESANTAGICETHSRLYENIIGRSLEFMPTLKKLCAENLDPSFKEMDIMDFYRLINYVEPIANRCDSDELTYSLHIIIRYEIERDLINGLIECEDVPVIWKNKYKEYLGVDVPNDREGCMQDIHWTDNEIGYFPSYLLGNLYGAMIFEKMEEDIHARSLIQEGKMDEILAYLAKNDYAYDWMEPKDWIKKVTGKELTSKPFIRYLKKKYGDLYD